MEHLEMHNRRNNLVLSGHQLQTISPHTDLRQSVVELLRTKVNVAVSPERLLGVHRLGAKPANQSSDSRNLLVKLADGEIRTY